jgi:hypothetical protein
VADVSVVLAAATAGFGLFGKSETAAVTPVASLTQALTDQNGALNANTDAGVYDQAAKNKLFDQTDKLGVAQRTLTDGAERQHDGLQAEHRAIAGHR